MNSNLLLEVRGRSMKLSAYEIEKETMRRVKSDLVTFLVEAERDGLTPKKRDIGMREIIRRHYESDEQLLDSVAKDVLANLKLAEKHLN